MAYGFMTIYWRDMIRFVRFKTLLVSSLLQPALWLAFFGIAMSSNFDQLTAGMPVPAGAHAVGYLTFMGAGIIAMTTLFTSLFGGIVILFDKNWGLMREILASPMDRNHIIFGIGLSGVTKSFIQAIIIMVFGILIGAAFFAGFTPFETVIGVAGILAFVAMFALGLPLPLRRDCHLDGEPGRATGRDHAPDHADLLCQQRPLPDRHVPRDPEDPVGLQPDDAPYHRYPVLCDRPGLCCAREALRVHADGYCMGVWRACDLYRDHVRVCVLAVQERGRDVRERFFIYG